MSATTGTLALTFTSRTLKTENTWALQAVLILLGSLFVGLMAQISIPLPFTPVPITGQTLGVVLVGASLGSRRGLASVALYLLEGIAGMPVFAAASFGATGGYLIGFLPAAYLTGWLAERGQDRKVSTAWWVFLAGQSVVFLIGVPWLALYVGGFKLAVYAGLLPFIPGEIVKTAIAAGLLPAAWRLVRGFDQN